MPTFQPPIVRDLPDPPRNLWRIVGPGIVAAGVGLSSGEFILWPFIASQVGLIFLWGAVVGVGTQLFLNMEIERYTLATGETALTGFNRVWKHWGLVLAIMVYFANLWPGWMLSSATLVTYLFGGGSAPVIAVIGLLIIGAALTLAPIVYVALERMIFVKVAAVVILVVLAIIFAITKDTWAALPASVASFGRFPMELGFALLFSAIAFAGAGGGQNLCQSNWIRDKGFGMGKYIPRLVSPVTGAEEAAPAPVSYIFETERSEHGPLAALVALRQPGTDADVLSGDGDHDRLHIDAGALDPFWPAGIAEQRRISADRRSASEEHCCALVRDALLGDRRVLAVRDRHGRHRLHQPAGGRCSEVHLFPDLADNGKPHLFRPGVGTRGDRLRDAALRSGAASGAPHHLRVGGRDDDVPLLRASHCDQQATPAGGDPDPVLPHGNSRMGDAGIRYSGGAHDLAAALDTVRRTGPSDKSRILSRQIPGPFDPSSLSEPASVSMPWLAA